MKLRGVLVVIVGAVLLVTPPASAHEQHRVESQTYLRMSPGGPLSCIDSPVSIGLNILCFDILPGEQTMDLHIEDASGLDVGFSWWLYGATGRIAEGTACNDLTLTDLPPEATRLGAFFAFPPVWGMEICGLEGGTATTGTATATFHRGDA